MTLIAISICSVVLIAAVIFRHPSRKRKMLEMQMERKAQQFLHKNIRDRQDIDRR